MDFLNSTNDLADILQACDRGTHCFWTDKLVDIPTQTVPTRTEEYCDLCQSIFEVHVWQLVDVVINIALGQCERRKMGSQN